MITRRTTENPCRRKTSAGKCSRTASPGSVRASGAAAFLTLLGISMLGLIGLAESAGLDHEVRPACPPEATVCQFDFLVTQQETMVWYDRPKHKGFPVVNINDTFFKRLPGGGICDDLAPISDEELADVVTADGRYRTAYFINDMMPGPSLVVYEGQQVAVRVSNRLLQEGTSVHWHGIKHRGTPWMDGVAGVTQCAINPEENFTYRFRATPSGTHWYHSHYGSQRTDGFFGALIVLERPADTTDTDRDPNRTPKDGPPAAGGNQNTTASDSNDTMTSESPATTSAPTPPRLPTFEKEFVLMVHDWFVETSEAILIRYLAENQRFTPGYDNLDECHFKTQQPDGSEVATIPFESGLINGKGHFRPQKADEVEVSVPLTTFDVSQGMFYRFRAINPSLNFGFKLSIDGHRLTVISSDGHDLEPVEADSVIVHGGERFDFYIQTDGSVDNYWVRAETLEMYNGRPGPWDSPIRQEKVGSVEAILRYHGAPLEAPASQPRACAEESKCVAVNCPFPEYAADANTVCINFDALRSVTPYELSAVNVNAFQEFFLNFHFPRSVGGVLRSMVNGIQFVLPSYPPQIQTSAVGYEHPCDMERCQDGQICQCTHEISLKRDNMIQMVLLSHVTPIPWPGVPASAHPIHLHGHHFYVMKVGYPVVDPVTKRYVSMSPDLHCPTDRCHNATWSNSSWLQGDIPGLNEVDPPLKDTVTVPAGGYVVIRFPADNPGWWIMHCHLELHQVEGMALLVKEGAQHEMNPAPPGFPTCGSFDWDADDFLDSLAPSPPPPPPPQQPSAGAKVAVTSAFMSVVMATIGFLL